MNLAVYENKEYPHKKHLPNKKKSSLDISMSSERHAFIASSLSANAF